MMKMEMLTKGTVNVDEYAKLSAEHTNATTNDTSQLYIKHDRLYKHRIFRINYTTYDVRRAQDVVNPNTSHSDIMVLRDDDDDRDADGEAEVQHFLFARVLGIYHADVVYTGTGTIDYQPRRVEFLWVRWFEPSQAVGWDSRRLDCINFFPVEHEYAFGFLDPNDVLRGCHILPRQALGKPHASIGLSAISKDKSDWHYYYVNRSVQNLQYY